VLQWLAESWQRSSGLAFPIGDETRRERRVVLRDIVELGGSLPRLRSLQMKSMLAPLVRGSGSGELAGRAVPCRTVAHFCAMATHWGGGVICLRSSSPGGRRSGRGLFKRNSLPSRDPAQCLVNVRQTSATSLFDFVVADRSAPPEERY
jgi:hypothetical protein